VSPNVKPAHREWYRERMPELLKMPTRIFGRNEPLTDAEFDLSLAKTLSDRRISNLQRHLETPTAITPVHV